MVYSGKSQEKAVGGNNMDGKTFVMGVICIIVITATIIFLSPLAL